MLRISRNLSFSGSFIIFLWSLYFFYLFLTTINKYIVFEVGAGKVIGALAPLIGTIFLGFIAFFGLVAGISLPKKISLAAFFQILNSFLLILASLITITDSMTLYKHPFSIWFILNLFVFLIFGVASFLTLYGKPRPLQHIMDPELRHDRKLP